MAPVLAIAAHIPSSEIGTGYFQETRPEALFRECSHYCETISSAKQMTRVLQIAMQNALGLQGVAVLGLSGDVAMQLVEDKDLKHHAMVKKPAILPVHQNRDALDGLINNSARVKFHGAAGCAAESED